ncbi:heavy metal efflux pump, CzcB family protein [Polaribacter irgensii 23-P]|uniref:Heavy metal efflux pump, CzcB family protein n=1 Tax=Polaribacter irgensii 23-P TaxID=313594 RepID=A4BZF2_9FLAO|nr:efflux RND transporter periplasmic adaptor subunit [Polaribacter irgensii]EAR12545.1 heavy metal efflux pump, CzcB family protein [Polaribacter irgensii 23-P]
MKHITIISLVSIPFLLFGCNHKVDSNSGNNEKIETSKKMEEGEQRQDAGKVGVVELTREQAETIGLEINSLEKKSLGNSIKVTGQLELFPQDRANISPFVGGNVRSIHVIEGDKVNKDQILAYLEHPNIITMQQEYQEKNNALIFLKQDFERKKTLYDKGVSSGKDFQMAQSKFRATSATVNGLRSKLKLLGLNIKAVLQGQIFSAIPITTPISGYVDEVMVSLGDYVAPQNKMFTISDNSEIHADFKVYEKDIRKVKEGQEIYFTVAAKPNKLLKAKIHAIGKTFENAPKALHVHADVHNEDKELLPGMYVEGRIVQDQKMVFAVPEDAIIKDGEQSFIFILDEEGKEDKNKMKFKMIPINIGITDLGFIEISLPFNITKDVKVVTKGAYTLSSEMLKGTTEHSH